MFDNDGKRNKTFCYLIKFFYAAMTWVIWKMASANWKAMGSYTDEDFSFLNAIGCPLINKE